MRERLRGGAAYVMAYMKTSCIYKLLLPLVLGSSALSAGEYTEPADSKSFGRLGVNWTPRAEDRATATRAWQMLSEGLKDLPRTQRCLRVVYVTFKDRPALPDYRERYDRIMKNIQAWYADQMAANGFPALTFNLELDEAGKLIVHDAYVDMLMKDVGIRSSGDVARAAARKVLADKGIDMRNEHVLIVCQLPDGVGPYYGGGASHNGIAYTCDQHDLDPLNFHDETDMPEARYPMTKGRNTTVYVGGTAHELGHAFGLPHTGFSWQYGDESGRSLMGDGNHHYGEELRGVSKGTFLAPTDAMKLASLPLFSGVETTLTEDAGDGDYCGTYVPDQITEVQTELIPEGVRVTGKVKMDRKPYGVILHLDPPEDDPWVNYDGSRFLRPRSWCDYDTSATGTSISDTGEFQATITRENYKKNEIELRITVLLADGSRSVRYINIPHTKK